MTYLLCTRLVRSKEKLLASFCFAFLFSFQPGVRVVAVPSTSKMTSGHAFSSVEVRPSLLLEFRKVMVLFFYLFLLTCALWYCTCPYSLLPFPFTLLSLSLSLFLLAVVPFLLVGFSCFIRFDYFHTRRLNFIIFLLDLLRLRT